MVRYVSDARIHPLIIVFRLEKKLGGCLNQKVYNYKKMVGNKYILKVAKAGSISPWIRKQPVQWVAQCNPTISKEKSLVLDISGFPIRKFYQHVVIQIDQQ